MPDPIVRSLRTSKIDRLGAGQTASSEPPAICRVLGPGRYELRSGHTGQPLASWTEWPVSGGIHVAWTPNGVIETWVMLTPPYVPIGTNLPGNAGFASVVATCVSTTAGALQTFLDSFGAATRVISTWDATTTNLQSGPQPAATLKLQDPRPDPRDTRPNHQCSPGDVESFRIDTAGNLIGARLGFVAVQGPVAGDWRLNAYTEHWYVEQSAALQLNQSALFRRAPVGATPPSGPSPQVWNVQYQCVN